MKADGPGVVFVRAGRLRQDSRDPGFRCGRDAGEARLPGRPA